MSSLFHENLLCSPGPFLRCRRGADPGFVFPNVLQAFRPVLRVPHIAHGKEVLPSSHRDGSPVSREPHGRGAEERGQE